MTPDDERAFTETLLRLSSLSPPTLAQVHAALAFGASIASPELTRFFAHRTHLISRSNVPPARTLLREALGERRGTHVRGLAERFVAAKGDLGVRLVRCGTTRPSFEYDARLRTFEPRGTRGKLAFSRDGSLVFMFAEGPGPLSVDEEGAGAWWSAWSTATGEFVDAREIGAFREGLGAFAVSADEKTLAVRRRREVDVYGLDRGRAKERRHVLGSSEGPRVLTFLEGDRLLGDDPPDLRLWDAKTSHLLGVVAPDGVRTHAWLRARNRILVAGSGKRLPGCLQLYALPAFTPEGVVRATVDGAPQAARMRPDQVFVDDASVEVIAVSPSERQIATGHENGDVLLWSVSDFEGGTSNAIRDVPTRRIGCHDDWVTSLAFADEETLLSGGFDGTVCCWDLAHADDRPNVLVAKTGAPAALATHAGTSRAVTGFRDGQVVLWESSAFRASREPRSAGELRALGLSDSPFEICCTEGDLDLESPEYPDSEPPNFRLNRNGVPIDIIAFDPLSAWTARDANTFVVRETDQHVSLWCSFP